ncbi:type I-B CRISPR-associated protein Cas7/Cst2/DevR [Thermocrinis jamiesonii]|uniref:type I-B CRISPR-associated protein Cas7/Cst2/DevR n=1 Tax=Thermocrinis jamiesonii TaxID=1302351 RepID=UPI000A846317|nr:type I-B CRISPR-associated protein Cas7/Cst2/DevR [Thermocrinis jamiesonii]
MEMKEMKGILTLTIITQRATSLNYGENIGNVSILKKLSLGDNSQITYVSDKALKYEMRKKGKEEKGWKLLDEKVKEVIENKRDKGKLDVDSFGKELIKNYEEFDLFGGLLTNLKGADGKKLELSYGDSVKRTAPVKVTYAYSISKFQGDMDFMNNIDAYNRYIKHIEQKDAQVITQSEQHSAHYYYTIAIDLDRIGVWEGEDQSEDVVSSEEKANRVKALLDIVRTLSRQIKGRWENLSPIFVIGGIYKIKNPFFMGCIGAKETEDGKLILDTSRLIDCMNLIPEGERENTLCGILSGYFANEQEIRENLQCKSVGEVFEELKKRVEEVYAVSKA